MFKQILNKLYGWYGKKTVLTVLAVVVLIIIYGVVFSGDSFDENSEKTALTENLPAVRLTTAEQLNNPTQISLIGEVKAISEAEIKPERSGKVIRVNVSLGQSVRAGQVLVELENASERASLLQAEASYELAIANSAQSDVSLTEAENRLEDSLQSIRNVNQNSYNTVNNAVLGTLDVFFSQPDSPTPGLRIGGIGNTPFINSERVAFQTILKDWQRETQITTRSIDDELAQNRVIRERADRVLNLINLFLNLLSDNRSVSGFSEAEVNTFRQNLTASQTQVTNAISAIDTAHTNLKNARENLEKIKLNTSGGTVSVSDAQIKQALGSLRSAQANYAKTILRSPINGTVNSLDVKVGAFVGPSDSLGVVANNGSFEVITFVSDSEREKINVGDAVKVGSKDIGQIAIIAPAINSVTKKIEVRIALDNKDFQVGETVRVTISPETVVETDKITIPLTAVKFNGAESFVYQVEEEALVALPVTVGEVRGRFVEITEGLTSTDEFVIDVRGRSGGEKVNVLTN